MIPTLLACIGLLLALILAALWTLTRLVARDQRRLLFRLEGLEREVASLRLAPRVAPRPCSTLPGRRSLAEGRIERSGLKPGTPAPAFELPSPSGGTVGLEEYRGRRVILVFTDPGCSPCGELLRELGPAHRRIGAAAPEVLIVGRGDPEANRRKVGAEGLPFRLVVQRAWEISRLYGIFAVPVAFLIDEKGVIAAPMAVGPLEVYDLLARSGRRSVDRPT
jgi:peroxiredoxin